MGRMRAAPGYFGSHTHQMTAAAFAQYDHVSAPSPANHILANHLLVPFDVRRDGVHILRTDDAKDLDIRIDAGDTNAVRVNPCEIVAVSAR